MAVSLELRAIYNKVASNLDLAHQRVLVLGISTGQVETMMGLSSAELTGVDINQAYLDLARQRLPKANLVQGLLPNIISSISGIFDLAISHDVLDCLSPADLVETLRSVRQKTDRLAITQIYHPHLEFYMSNLLRLSGRKFPGIENWPKEFKKAGDELTTSLGLGTSPKADPVDALDQLQTGVEGILDHRFAARLTDGLRWIGYRQPRITDPYFESRSRAAQMAFHHYQTFWELNHNVANHPEKLPSNPERANEYIRYQTVSRLAAVIGGVFDIALYMQVLAVACKQAGFDQIKATQIGAVDNRLVESVQVVQALNRSFGLIKPPSVQLGRIPKTISTTFVSSPLGLYDPNPKPSQCALAWYLEAA